MLELEVTYDASHINREELPLKIFLEPKGSKELKRFPLKEYQVNIPLKIEGEWVGMPDQYGVDYVLTWPAIQSEQFFPGKYTLKIYSNDKHQAEKILGVIKIAARLYDRNGMVEEIKE